MSRTRTRALGMSMAMALAVSTIGATAPALAADSPEAAVDEVFAMAASRDFTDIDAVVCEAEREAVLSELDVQSQAGLGDAIPPNLTFAIDDVVVEVTSNDGATATAQVTATMSMSAPEDEVEAMVRSMLEAELDPGEELDEDDVAFMLPLMASGLNGTFPIDEELTLVAEDGEWLVCGGLGGVPEEPDFGFEASVSTEGLCAYVSPDEMSTLSALQYDSSSGFGQYCSYSTSDFDDYHGATVNLELRQDAEYMAGFYAADEPLTIAGAASFATGPDTFGTQLTQVGEDVLVVSVNLTENPPEGVDWLSQASLVTELFMPHVADAKLMLAGPTPAPTPEPTPEILLCESLTLDALNELTGLGFDEASGDSAYCSYSSFDGEPGFHTVTVSLAETAMDDYATWLPDMEETSLGDARALQSESLLIVELPGGAFTLSVGGFVDSGDESASMTSDELLRLVAELLLPAINVPEPTITADEAVDLDALAALLDDPQSGLLDPGPTLARPMCDYVDLEAINALGILEYDNVNGFFDELCAVSQSDPAVGYSEVSMFHDGFSIDDARSAYADAVDIAVAGLPGLRSQYEVRVETSAGPIAFTAILPDAAVEAGMVAADITIPVAELVVAAIEGDGPAE